ncbi:helix-turn-helix domain-containing protein [Rothia nasimurium]|uniref:helix-turn-helix domain-containing protein n=1 Tax=Rothia nasimurium TaxID=85336 RepID=UPI001F273B8D|nr:helix-turn-helix transcriptional regulator [Rothia nasimurium]
MDREDFAARTGERIRALRQSKDWSQNELARRLNDVAGGDGSAFHAMTIKRIEEGKRSLKFDEAVMLSQLFGINVTRLQGAFYESGYVEDLENALLVLTSRANEISNGLHEYLSAYWAARYLYTSARDSRLKVPTLTALSLKSHEISEVLAQAGRRWFEAGENYALVDSGAVNLDDISQITEAELLELLWGVRAVGRDSQLFPPLVSETNSHEGPEV